MAQVQNTPLTADPSILRDIESEVTQETRPLLQFIVNNAKLIVGVVVGLLVALAVAGVWRWHTQSQQEALQGELGQIMHQRATPEQLDALEKLAKDAPARLKAPVYAVQAQSALAQQNYAKAGEAYGKAAATIGVGDQEGIGILGAGAAQKRTDPAAVLGGTYKAITFAMRAGYATAQEKIAKGVEKITRLLGDVKSNTSDMADNLDFDTV